MTTVKRPKRSFSFTDFARNNPGSPPPGDRIDAMFIELADAIRSTQDALAQIRRDDGMLKSNLVSATTLDPSITKKLSDDIVAKVEPTRALVAGTAALARQEAAAASGHARDAEAAAIATAQFLSAMTSASKSNRDAVSDADNSADRAEAAAIDSENWATYSHAQSDNAIAAKDEALAWAEYLAGPVIDNTKALDFIEASKFPNGLFYQPVQGSGGLGGLWSAKWWAIYAQQLVGNIGFYYLGAWATPPMPGQTNPNTGETVPNPLAVGSFYYDTTLNTVMVWNGSSWQAPGVQVAPGFRARYVYIATADQVDFSGEDINDMVPLFTSEGHDVYLNGVRLLPGDDYDVDVNTDTLTLVEAPGAGAVVQWDLMIPPDQINSAKVDAFKVEPLLPDGTKTIFALSYIDPSTGPPAVATNVGTGAQLMVSLDGIVQEPGVDFNATGSTLTMSSAPPADSRFWAVWFRPHVPVELPP